MYIFLTSKKCYSINNFHLLGGTIEIRNSNFRIPKIEVLNELIIFGGFQNSKGTNFKSKYGRPIISSPLAIIPYPAAIFRLFELN